MNSTPYYTEELTYSNALTHIEMASNAGRYEKIILEEKPNYFSIHFYRWGYVSQAEIDDRMLVPRKVALGSMLGVTEDYFTESFIGNTGRDDSRVFLFEKKEYYVLDTDSCVSLPKDKQYVFLGLYGGYNIFRIVRDPDGE